MMSRRKPGDRRGRARFDVVGELWGTFETVTPLTLRNIGRGGALIESRISLSVDSIHRVVLLHADERCETEMRVRHVTAATGPGGESRYLIGIEFLKVPAGMLDRIDGWVAGSTNPRGGR